METPWNIAANEKLLPTGQRWSASSILTTRLRFDPSQPSKGPFVTSVLTIISLGLLYVCCSRTSEEFKLSLSSTFPRDFLWDIMQIFPYLRRIGQDLQLRSSSLLQLIRTRSELVLCSFLRMPASSQPGLYPACSWSGSDNYGFVARPQAMQKKCATAHLRVALFGTNESRSHGTRCFGAGNWAKLSQTASLSASSAGSLTDQQSKSAAVFWLLASLYNKGSLKCSAISRFNFLGSISRIGICHTPQRHPMPAYNKPSYCLRCYNQMQVRDFLNAYYSAILTSKYHQ